MEEFLKYISPFAILTSIWGIYQFYEKRKYERNEKRRIERFDVIKYFHSNLNNLKVNLIDFELETEIIFKLIKDKALELHSLGKDFKVVEDFKELNELRAESQALYISASELKEKSEIEMKKLSKFLKSSLLELNNVNLLNIVVEKKLNEGISNLSNQIKDIIIQIETNKRKVPFNDGIIEIIKSVYWIEKLMVDELK